MRVLVQALVLATAVAVAGTANADEFYKGKTVTYIVSTSPGGGYDTYARLVGKYLAKHLGARVQIKNLPGAGHIVGTNTLAASKPDGLTIGTFNTGLIYAQILKRDGVQFDLRAFEWIGKASSDPRALVLGKESGMKTYADLAGVDKPVKFATSGVGSASYTDTQLIQAALDLKIDVVPGFNGNEGELAMLRGEIGAQVGSMSSLQSFVDNGYGTFALAIGGNAAGVPQAADKATTAKGRSIIALVQAMSELGRLTAAPAGTPAERVADLRAAYKAALTDPALLAEAEKLGIPIEPAYGETVAGLVGDALNQSPETVEIIAAAVNVEIKLVTVKTELLDLSTDFKKIKFASGDATIKAKISGSRTAITINGEEAKRKKLKVGMVCEISYDPEHEDNEPKKIACEG
ncbi:MAG: tripartite tricarboxylate transporter substrate-binding protein [Alphaproteobacteria bacterium]|nr:tripartite tricarboxylate transporter substrate-binding protein [Alphaproteobacteria bacterium]